MTDFYTFYDSIPHSQFFTIDDKNKMIIGFQCKYKIGLERSNDRYEKINSTPKS